MKDVFYGFLVVWLVLNMVFIWAIPKISNVEKYNSGVVIDKDNDFLLGNVMRIQFKNDTIKTVRCYDIIFEKYNVGDTIK